jgi:hypothetical protein
MIILYINKQINPMKKFLFILFIFFCALAVYGQEYTLDLATELNLDYIVDADKFKIFLYNQVPNSDYTIEVQSKSNFIPPLTLVTIQKPESTVSEIILLTKAPGKIPATNEETECERFKKIVNELIKKASEELTGKQIRALQEEINNFINSVPQTCDDNSSKELINKLRNLKSVLSCNLLILDYNILVTEINSISDEKKVNEIRIKIKGFLERLKREDCAELWKMEEKLNFVLDKIDGKSGNGQPGIVIPKNSNENLIVTIYNKDKTKKWQYKFSSTPRGEWFPTFGLIFVSHFFNPTVEYIPQKQSDGTIRIGENEKGKGEGEFVPIIAYCWLPNSSNNTDWSCGFSAGLGYTSEAPIMMGAVNFTYNRNINFLFGIVGKSIKKPNETFQVGQTVTATEVESLNRTTFTILPHFGITLRLGTNPF